MKKVRGKLFETKYFGLLIGLGIALLCLLLQSFPLFRFLDLMILDTHFAFRDQFTSTSAQAGTVELGSSNNPNISQDILLVAIDNKSLTRFGRFPWPRYVYANFLNNLARIQNQNARESAVLIDVFFNEPSAEGENDALLERAIKENGRTYFEEILHSTPSIDSTTLEEETLRHQGLIDSHGIIKNIKGNWQDVPTFRGVEGPLLPFGKAAQGYGHATFLKDIDEKYRRQALVARTSLLKESIKLPDLNAGISVNSAQFERLGWTDKEGNDHTVAWPLDEKALASLKTQIQNDSPPVIDDANKDGEMDPPYWVINRYQDYFIPAITLSLALKYFNRTLDDIEVVLGQYIKIPSPQMFNAETGTWEPYRIRHGAEFEEPLKEIKIPIDDYGMMMINFMGGRSGESEMGEHDTYHVSSILGYASAMTPANPQQWKPTQNLGNKILMLGAFAQGIASDEKTTPFGLMYGVEMHANALNTILMNKFIQAPPGYITFLILIVFCLLAAFYTSRIKGTPISIVITIVLIFGYFIFTSIIFDTNNLLFDFAMPGFGMMLTLLSVIAYRVMTEEKEKRLITSMFGKYVSPEVVEQMVLIGEQPELGGTDKELTVFFSDIRGFTTLSEAMTPQELVNHLNTYLSAMADIIWRYRGTLDKYVGDEIMCFWGAPLPQAKHALLACSCALEQMRKLKELNDAWPPERRIDIGIGVNSGIMTVGNMGSQGRMNYTLMGDNVNLGARLEGTNKQYGTNVIISEYTYSLVKDDVIVRELDNIRVKGKNKPVLIFELVDIVTDITEYLHPTVPVATKTSGS